MSHSDFFVRAGRQKQMLVIGGIVKRTATRNRVKFYTAGQVSKAAIIHFVSDGINWYEVARTLGL